MSHPDENRIAEEKIYPSCPDCGIPVRATDARCMYCGAKLEFAAPGVAQPESAESRPDRFASAYVTAQPDRFSFRTFLIYLKYRLKWGYEAKTHKLRRPDGPLVKFATSLFGLALIIVGGYYLATSVEQNSLGRMFIGLVLAGYGAAGIITAVSPKKS